MGFGSLSIGSLILILIIVLVLFGGKRVRHLGEDLGQALKGFRKGMKEPDTSKAEKTKTTPDKPES